MGVPPTRDWRKKDSPANSLINTNLTPKSRPRQEEAIALIRAEPRTKAELRELMRLTSTNLEKLIQILISKGEIIPNPATGKYEIYSKP